MAFCEIVMWLHAYAMSHFLQFFFFFHSLSHLLFLGNYIRHSCSHTTTTIVWTICRDCRMCFHYCDDHWESIEIFGMRLERVHHKRLVFNRFIQYNRKWLCRKMIWDGYCKGKHRKIGFVPTDFQQRHEYYPFYFLSFFFRLFLLDCNRFFVSVNSRFRTSFISIPANFTSLTLCRTQGMLDCHFNIEKNEQEINIRRVYCCRLWLLG